METLLHAFEWSLGALKMVFFGGAIAAAGFAVVEWGVRTKRINPFSAPARWSRRLTSPFIKPVERSVIRAGGTPASAPWWTLVAVVVGGIIVLSLLEFTHDQLAYVQSAANKGSRDVLRLLVHWTFSAFFLALLVRVIASWLRLNPFGRIVRWATVVTEPVLAPVRPFTTWGMIDLSPLVVYFFLTWIVQPLVMRMI